jgi:lycopene cyclase domain-containing protein
MEKWTYLLLLAASVAIPLSRSFEKRVSFVSKWPRLFMGILLMMIVFIPWDIIFTRLGIWSFNYDYVSGYYLQSLPVEEWLFFIIIPYCCIFIYEVLLYFFPRFNYPKTSYALTVVLGLATITVSLLNTDKIYTFVVMYISAVLLFWQLYSRSHKTWLSHFYLMYFISLIPFLIVNGVLTALPVVEYDNTANLAIRAGSIPVEDFFYFMSMMFITMMVYQSAMRKKQTYSSGRKTVR